jgi:hypothetical protein
MKVQITQQHIFTDVDTHRIPQFFHQSIQKIFEFLEEHQVVIPANPYHWEEWQESQDTGIYVYPGRATSTTHDWIVEGYIRNLGHYDPTDFVFNHRLMIQNSWQKVKIEILVLIGAGKYEVFFDVNLPESLEDPFMRALLGS